MARRFGASDHDLDTLDDLDTSTLPDPEKAAIRFAERMTTDFGDMTQADVDTLRAYWSDDEIVEMAAVVGLFAYLNRFAEAFGIWPTRPGEGGPDDPGEEAPRDGGR